MCFAHEQALAPRRRHTRRQARFQWVTTKPPQGFQAAAGFPALLRAGEARRYRSAQLLRRPFQGQRIVIALSSLPRVYLRLRQGMQFIHIGQRRWFGQRFSRISAGLASASWVAGSKSASRPPNSRWRNLVAVLHRAFAARSGRDPAGRSAHPAAAAALGTG